MTENGGTEPVFPHIEPQDIQSLVSSLTRRDLDDFLVHECGVSRTTDWQWRVLGALAYERDRKGPALEVAPIREEEFFPEVVESGGELYAARNYPYGHLLKLPNGRYSRQIRDGRAIWVKLP